jgi:hypothetical protein
VVSLDAMMILRDAVDVVTDSGNFDPFSYKLEMGEVGYWWKKNHAGA